MIAPKQASSNKRIATIVEKKEREVSNFMINSRDHKIGEVERSQIALKLGFLLSLVEMSVATK